MDGEHGGMDPGEPSEDEREFRRMMDALGGEGLGRMIEGLTEKIRANPGDTEALTLRGLLYSQLGEHRRAAKDYGSVIDLDPDNADAYLGRAHANAELGEHRAAVEDYDAAIRRLPAMRWRTTAVGRATPSRATWPGRSATSTWLSSWLLMMQTPGTTGG